MFQEQRLILALSLIIVVVGVILLSPASPTGFLTATVPGSAHGVDKKSLTINYDFEYSGVTKIALQGVPGGNLCQAAIRFKAYDIAGKKVAEATTAEVGAHNKASKTISVTNIKVKKIVGEPVSGWFKCDKIDDLSVTLTYTLAPETTKPTVTSSLTPTEVVAGKPVTLEVDAKDYSGISDISVIAQNVVVTKASCTGSLICKYTFREPESDIGKSKSLTITVKDGAPTPNTATTTIIYTVIGKVTKSESGALDQHTFKFAKEYSVYKIEVKAKNGAIGANCDSYVTANAYDASGKLVSTIVSASAVRDGISVTLTKSYSPAIKVSKVVVDNGAASGKRLLRCRDVDTSSATLYYNPTNPLTQ